MPMEKEFPITEESSPLLENHTLNPELINIRSSVNLTKMLLEILIESPINTIQKAHLENALLNLCVIESNINNALTSS